MQLWMAPNQNIYSLLGMMLVMISGCVYVGYRFGLRLWDTLEKQYASSEQSEPPPMPEPVVQKQSVPSPQFHNQPTAPPSVSVEAFYEIVATELEQQTHKTGIWTKAFAVANGDQTKARVIYIRLRVAQLEQEAIEAARTRQENDRRAKQDQDARPLRDPVRFFASILFWTSFISFALAWLKLLVSSAPSTLVDLGLMVLISVIACMPLPLGIWLLVRRVKQTPVIYLRAFRSDRRAVRLRRLLKAALGPRLRLSGIRPPRERSNWLFRLAASGFVALRYLGSPYFDLEAEDHDWIARLLATYAHSRFAFIDVRDLTIHVENEIRLTYYALRTERCVFIVSDERALPEWRAMLGQVLGIPGELHGQLQLLDYLGDERVDEKDFVSRAMEIIDQIPAGTAQISQEAVDFARAHVAAKDWATPFWETDRGLFFIALGLELLLGLAINLLPPEVRQRGWTWLTLAFGGLTLLFYLPAWARSWRQAGVDARYRRKGEPRPRPPLVFSFLLVLSWPFIFFSLWTALEGARRRAQRGEADNILTMAQMATRQYEFEYGRLPAAARWGEAMLGTDREVNPRAITFLPERKFLADPWGTPIRYRLDDENHRFELRSAGPDRQFDTRDDLHRP